MAQLAKATDPITGEKYLVDMGTKNQSFLMTHQELRHLGVKNNAFMLKIIDPTLAGVDPFDPNLDHNTQDRIQLECARNFWYYAREVARVPIPNGPPVPIYLHRPSCAQFWLFLKHIDSTLNVPRRCYKTSNTLAGPYAWAYNFGLQGGNMVMFNYENSQSWHNLDVMKGMLDALPPYMHYSAYVLEEADPKHKKKAKVQNKTDNVKSIRHSVNRNMITTRGKAANVDAAMKFGRGDAINMPYFDEAEWINHLTDILAASGPSYGEALNMAIKSGAAACRLFTTTPGYLNIPHQRENYEKFISIQPRWSEKIYDMTNEEIDQYMMDNGNGYTKILYIEYNYIQCRRDDEWLKGMLTYLNGNVLKLRTEVLLQRLSADENGPFDPFDVDYIVQNQKNPIGDILINGTYRLDIYDHLDQDIGRQLDPMLPYFIGIDPAQGVGGDKTAIVGVNPYNLKIAFEFGSSYIGEPKQVALIVSLVRMLPYSIVFIETRSSGSAIIAIIRASYPDVAARLYKSEYDPSKIYIQEKPDPHITEKEYREAIEKKLYGIATGETSRKQIQDLWVEYMKEYKRVITSENVVRELSMMTKNTAGKILASNGSHDDYAMAWGFCLWGYHHGQNLQRWGFVKPEKHPLEKDPMPLREKKSLNIRALYNKEARIVNDANQKVILDRTPYNRMIEPKINGFHRTMQFVPENGVIQTTDLNDISWVHFVDGVDQENQPVQSGVDFEMFY